MSKVIVNDHLYDADEIDYLEARGRFSEISLNKKLYGPGGTMEGVTKPTPETVKGDVLELDQDIYEHVLGLDTTALKAELRKYKIDPTGDESILRSKLAQRLQSDRDDSNR